VRLRQGDVIFIPPVGPQAAIVGSVNSQAVFELKSAGVPLADAIDLAGGLTTLAHHGQKATVERIEGRAKRKVDEFGLDADGLAKTIRDGDLITIYGLSHKFDNAITLRGFVARPGRLPWREGMRVSDVIPNKTALVAPEYWARRDGFLPRSEQARIVRYEEIDWNYAVVERMKEDLTTELVPFGIGRAVLEQDPQHNLQLKPGDIITVFSKDDIRGPANRKGSYVRLEGEFIRAGIYQAQPGETLRQLVARVGGLTPQAYLYGGEFTREATRKAQQKQLDESIDRLEQEMQRVLSERGSTGGEDQTSVKTQMVAQQKLLDRLRRTPATGRVVLELPPDSEPNAIPDMVLEDGDRFMVPAKPSTVAVFGSVFNQNVFLYHPEKRLEDYLAQAGGPIRTADKGSIYLVRADGSVISQRQKGFLGGVGGERMMPGDAIVVPEDLDRGRFTRDMKDWTQILYQLGLAAAGLAALWDIGNNN
jgi:protein involved in polysaccharide export with SLBB domain